MSLIVLCCICKRSNSNDIRKRTFSCICGNCLLSSLLGPVPFSISMTPDLIALLGFELQPNGQSLFVWKTLQCTSPRVEHQVRSLGVNFLCNIYNVINNVMLWGNGLSCGVCHHILAQRKVKQSGHKSTRWSFGQINSKTPRLIQK